MTKLSDLTGDYILDTAQTRIGFVARHTMATRVRGQFDEFTGSAHLDGDDPTNSSATLTIRARSIQTGNRRRDQPVRDKFLGAAQYPTITFTSTAVQRVDPVNFKVTGELIIRGVSRPVTVDFRLLRAERDPRGDLSVSLRGSAAINRKDWGVHWNAAAGMVSKTVMLEVEIAATRPS
jgi:polyisoprenoid-binding protein YceI